MNTDFKKSKHHTWINHVVIFEFDYVEPHKSVFLLDSRKPRCSLSPHIIFSSVGKKRYRKKKNFREKLGKKITLPDVGRNEYNFFFYWKKKVCWVDIVFERKANLTELDYVKRILLSQRLGIHSNWDISILILSIHNEGNKQPKSLLFPDILISQLINYYLTETS